MIKPIPFIRWTARALSAAMVAMVVIIAVGEGLPQLSELNFTDQLLFVTIFVMIAGAALAWWKDMIGGAVIVLGFAAFWIINSHFPGDFFFVFGLAGLLHLLAWLLKAKPPIENAEPPKA
jgi:hypothetical protein